MSAPLVTVVVVELAGHTWTWTCSVHGRCIASWYEPEPVYFDAMGHMAAHHPLAAL